MRAVTLLPQALRRRSPGSALVKKRRQVSFDDSNRTDDTLPSEYDDEDLDSLFSRQSSLGSRQSAQERKVDAIPRQVRKQPSRRRRRCTFIDEIYDVPVVTEVWIRPRLSPRGIARCHYTRREFAEFRRQAEIEDSVAAAMFFASSGQLSAAPSLETVHETGGSQVDSDAETQAKSVRFAELDDSTRQDDSRCGKQRDMRRSSKHASKSRKRVVLVIRPRDP